MFEIPKTPLKRPSQGEDNDPFSFFVRVRPVFTKKVHYLFQFTWMLVFHTAISSLEFESNWYLATDIIYWNFRFSPNRQFDGDLGKTMDCEGRFIPV